MSGWRPLVASLALVAAVLTGAFAPAPWGFALGFLSGALAVALFLGWRIRLDMARLRRTFPRRNGGGP